MLDLTLLLYMVLPSDLKLKIVRNDRIHLLVHIP